MHSWEILSLIHDIILDGFLNDLVCVSNQLIEFLATLASQRQSIEWSETREGPVLILLAVIGFRVEELAVESPDNDAKSIHLAHSNFEDPANVVPQDKLDVLLSQLNDLLTLLFAIEREKDAGGDDIGLAR